MAGEIHGVNELLSALRALPAQARQASARGLERAALIVHRDAVAYAPRSPSSAQVRGLRKTRRSTAGQRKARAFSRPKPGGLERSIDWQSDATQASVFVSASAEAGKYGGRMHDERGKTWSRLGPGSRAKGGRVGDKFIERALVDNQTKIEAVLREELEKGLKL